ncbi:sugar 3,4-ketoisomerase [Treponema pedis]|uniref:sugar 3,4-ketoisomerase n=1 Tax=Treponema pedis TaxID=409322 RepID=UPI003D1DAB50
MLSDCHLINLDNKQSNITLLNDTALVPFVIKRIYYLYSIPEKQDRGAHAHKELYQVILAASGSFTIELDDGKNKKKFFLNSPSCGLFITPGIWRNLMDFSFGSIALILASEYYTEDDYIRNYNDFLRWKA